MTVTRIVSNISSDRMDDAKMFYGGILGLEVAMDMGWIVTFTSLAATTPQLTIAREGGSGAPVPDLSIEVDNFDTVLKKIKKAGLAISYGPVDEPWGVRRFFVRDPLGRLVNILTHTA